nr:hypothetical protein [Tanacetum cinerariifolium]
DCLQDLGKERMTGTIAEPVLEEYITVTRRNYISENDGGKIIEKGFKTYDQFKNDWIYEWNDKIPWDNEWYEALVDYELKEKALRNKVELEKSMNHEGESSDDAWRNYLPIDE